MGVYEDDLLRYKAKFEEVRDKHFKEEEYYKVVFAVVQDSYDSYYLPITNIQIEVTKIVPKKQTGFWGQTRTINVTEQFKENMDVYAVKNKNGIFEMVTGKKLSMSPSNQTLFCRGIIDTYEGEIFKIMNLLKLLENNPNWKTQYINEVINASNRSYKKYIEEELKKQKKDHDTITALQYLKSYRPPQN